MKFTNQYFLFFALILLSQNAGAELNVITTTTDLRDVVKSVGADLVSVESLTKGTQDPHYVEAKPSFIPRVHRTDLLLAVGLGLEEGWLPNIVRNARNPKIQPGSRGYLEVGTLVERLEIPTGEQSRAMGDVHANGNPHVLLDPLRAGTIARGISQRLGELDPKNAKLFESNALELENLWKEKTKAWKKRIEASGIRSVVSYHKTLSYFFDRFGLENPAILEPKPGIPPTSGHILSVIDVMGTRNVRLIMVENYFDSALTRKIIHDLPDVRVVTVPVAVEGSADVNSLDDLYEKLVSSVTGDTR